MCLHHIRQKKTQGQINNDDRRRVTDEMGQICLQPVTYEMAVSCSTVLHNIYQKLQLINHLSFTCGLCCVCWQTCVWQLMWKGKKGDYCWLLKDYLAIFVFFLLVLTKAANTNFGMLIIFQSCSAGYLNGVWKCISSECKICRGLLRQRELWLTLMSC